MEPNRLVLNPDTPDSTANPKCPLCDEKIKEVSGEAENRFVCGCDELVEFEFTVEDSGTDNQSES